jgi:hypothetical protein
MIAAGRNAIQLAATKVIAADAITAARCDVGYAYTLPSVRHWRIHWRIALIHIGAPASS